jgi:hypothetical protein
MTKLKSPYKPPYKFVEVVWEDAASNSETWVTAKEITAPEEVITRGWLVRDEPKYVAVASSVSNEDLEEDHVGNTLTIPRGMIMTMRELRLTTAREKQAKKPPAAVITVTEPA